MYHHRLIREALRHRPAALSPAAFALGCAVWQVQPVRQSHTDCLLRLPSFVESVCIGEGDSVVYLETRRHLRKCPSCARIYLDLIDLATADAESSRP
jgi:hypothetical protein